MTRKDKLYLSWVIRRSSIKVPKTYIGSEYGGWSICTDDLSHQSIVYSFGIGEDLTFDLGLISRCGCQVYAFDPTPRTKAWLEKKPVPKTFTFFDYGIADYDGKARFHPPDEKSFVSHTLIPNVYDTTEASFDVEVKTLATIMNQLRHAHVDVLKLDVEGIEFSVLKDIVRKEVSVTQILVEYHHRFSGFSLKDTIESFKLLYSHGYHCFSASADRTQFSFIDGSR